MCGIVGIASNGPMTLQLKELFQNLLYMDVLRGEHATGIAAIDTVNQSINVVKKAIPAPFFLEEEATKEIMAFKHNYNIFIGHNRYATSGNKDKDEFAHPFHHGNIVGVHNGSLRDQSLLDDHKNFEVDSENIFYHMNLHGLDDTLSKLNGSFSLVWYDAGDNTLNFIRNDDRPMAVGKLTGGAYIWASEMNMLKWLIKRHKTLRFERVEKDDEKGVQEDFLYSLSPGRHYKIPFVGRQSREPTLTQKVLPTFPVTTWGKGYSGYEDYSPGNRRNNYGNNYSRVRVIESPVLQKVTDRVKEGTYLELRLDQIIEEKSYAPGATYRNRFLFAHNLYPGDKCSTLKLYNLGFENDTSGISAEDIGKTFYGRVTSAYYASNYSPEGTWNESNTGSKERIVVTISDITRTAPKNFLSFCKLSAVQTKTNPPKTRLRLKAGVQTEADKKHNPDTGTIAEDRKLVPAVVQLANCRVDKLSMMELAIDNHYRCSNCAKPISRVQTTGLYAITERERGGDDAHYIMCSHECYKQMKEFCAQAESTVFEGYIE